ncbi:uncharacterized protein LOC119734130 [Patiria miniata]|uniref:SET domain-containing protein n=1 Tax=Patiria miniata TaxID=46514 RepID=A0A914AJ34_PATMI|nr:uncharacterized protein LOC119734130 [Patiria miniata]
MRVIMNVNTPALCLLSIEPIVNGSEILYDYGVNELPWKSNQVKPYIPNITVTCSSKTGNTQVIAPSSDVHTSDITTISATSTDHNLPCLPISVVSGETTASSSDVHTSVITTISATSTDHNLPCLPISVVSGETTASSR